MASYRDVVRDDSGYQRPVSGAQVYLLKADGSLATAAVNPLATDDFGAFEFTGVPDGVYFLEVRVAGVTYTRNNVIIGDPPQYVGPAGPSNNTRVDLAALKAASIVDKTSLYDRSLWMWTSGDFAGQADDVNVVKADSTPLSVGAWVRQRADSLPLRTAGGGAVTESVQAMLGRAALTPEQFGATGYATSDDAAAGVDSTAAIQAMANAGGALRLPVTGNGRWYKVGTVSWPSHTRCSKLRLFVRDSNRDVQPVLIDGRQTAKSDYVFEDLEIHGNRLGQTELGFNAAGVPGSVSGTDSQRSGVVIQGRVSDVSLVRPKIWYCAVDGIWIYHDGRDNDPDALNPANVDDLFIRNVTITEPDLRWNGRHGGSSECIDGLTIIGGISTRNGYDMPGYPMQPYSDGGNGRTTNFYAGPKYGRAWDCESYLVGTRYQNHVIDGLDGRGNWGGSILLYHRRHPSVAGDICKNIIIRNCLVDDEHGASGDGSITAFALNDQTEAPYTNSDAFNVLRFIDNRADDNYFNINNATDIEVRGGWISVETSVGYSVVFGACADVRYCDVASNKPVFGRPMAITRTGTTIGDGWTVANETLTFRHDLPNGASRYRYTASVTPTGAGQAKATVTCTPGWRLTPAKPSSINSTTGNLVMSDAFPSSDGANAVDYYIVANGLNPTAFVMEFDAERIS